jgi:PAS domain S-box-containing protein
VSLPSGVLITAVAAHLGHGLLTINQSGRINFVNEAATAITGYAKDEMVGQVVEELFPSTVEKDKNIHPVTHAQNTKETVAYQSQSRSKEINLIVIPTDIQSSQCLDASRSSF